MTTPLSVPLAVSPSRRWRHWCLLVPSALAALALFLWAQAPFPPAASPWTFWLWPSGAPYPTLSPSLTWTFLAAALLFSLLSGLAWFLHTTPPHAKTLPLWLSLLLIATPALAANLYAARHAAHNPALWNLLLTALLLFILYRQRRSLWWAALYAWHPLTLLPLDPLRPFSSSALTLPSLPYLLLHQQFLLDTPPHTLQIALYIAAALAFLLPLLLGLSKRWPLPQTFSHALMLALLTLPTVPLAGLLYPLALLPLFWNRAVWVASLTLLAALALPHLSAPPAWLLLLVWLPPVILEIGQCLTDLFPRRLPA